MLSIRVRRTFVLRSLSGNGHNPGGARGLRPESPPVGGAGPIGGVSKTTPAGFRPRLQGRFAGIPANAEKPTHGGNP